ncbi:nitrile hydratase subunit alpha [Sinorhizobium medicae]|uniref:nitrile hydratase subunit alpha n=1 Tax=Sinorhizobium medicae TaxID=110321 RepID=UPI0018658CEE|nr:nitrile hydratase subunit alpha [Sinorhizobium medicae]
MRDADGPSSEVPLPVGAMLVARAWRDPLFKHRLLTNSGDVLAEYGVGLEDGTILAVLKNEPRIHHAVVCTLCSCYPTSLLGPAPCWYGSAEYRRRMETDPRGVLSQQLGLNTSDETEIRVYDSTFRHPYLVLPLLPEGFEKLGVEEMALSVTLDSLIGTGIAGAKTSWHSRPFGGDAKWHTDHRLEARMLVRDAPTSDPLHEYPPAHDCGHIHDQNLEERNRS